jgi:hypothetical protein
MYTGTEYIENPVHYTKLFSVRFHLFLFSSELIVSRLFICNNLKKTLLKYIKVKQSYNTPLEAQGGEDV